MAFVHLHNHSHYSLLDGLSQIKPMIKRAQELEFEALALTDHGNMYGCIEFYQACEKAGIKPIIGQEAYIAPNSLHQKRPNIDNKYNHLILLAQNFEGYKNLMRLTSIAHKEGFYYKPRMDMEILAKHSEGLIASSGCIRGMVAQAILDDNFDNAKEYIRKHQEVFGEDKFFLEVQHHPGLDKQQIVNQGLFRLSEEMGVPVIATCDCHYLHPQDSDAQDLLVCIASGKTVTDSNRLDMRDIDLSMKSEQQMRSAFSDHPEACDRTVEVAKMIDLEIPLGEYHFPNFEIPKEREANDYLRERAYQGLGWRYKQTETREEADKLTIDEVKAYVDAKDPGIAERLEYELDIIKQKGYPTYFLIVEDFVNWATAAGIQNTTRGSAAGSLVSYAMGVIQINPLDYNLPFERFLNPLRPSAPDIDFDIQDDRRHEVIEYVSQKYGEEKVAQIITFGTMAARGAVRDVGRALGMPYGEVDRISKMIPMGSQGFAMTIQRAIDENPELKQAYNLEPSTKQLLDFAQKVEGCARHSSVHAAGVVISPTELTDFTAYQSDNEGGGNVSQYEMHSVEEAGLVKFDFLGIRNLSILGRSIELVKRIRGEEIDILKIPLDDKKTFEMLAQGDTFGAFQLSGRGMTRYLMELQPTTIHDIMAMVALFRPGPMESIPEYIARKKDPSKVDYPDPRLEPVLEKSFGIMTYQDDVLMTAITIAGYDWLGADKLRKAMGKKIPEEMEKQKKKFLQGAQEHGGLSEKEAQKLFKLIEPFAAYGFNKAHAASYGIVAYQTAYMKANYTVEYMAALMTAEHHDLEKIAEAVKECKRMGIEVLPPDVNESFSNFTVVSPKKIRFGLLAIKGVGEGIINSIIEVRKADGPFASLQDFVMRVQDRNLNKKVMEALTKAGALECFNERNQILLNVEQILSFAKTQHQIALTGQESLFGATEKEARLNLPSVAQASEPDKMSWEKETLGLYLTSHPFEKMAKHLKGLVSQMTNIDQCEDNQTILVAGSLVMVKNHITKKGDMMAFTALEDGSAQKELIVFPRTFAENPTLWEADSMMLVRAKVSTRDGQAKLIADKGWKLTEENVVKIKAKLKEGHLPTPISGNDPSNQPSGVYFHLQQAPDAFRTGQLKQLFAKYQGPVPVYLKIMSDHDFKTIKTSFRITPNEESKYQLEKLTGPGSMRVIR